MAAPSSVTGEALHEDEVDDTIPGAMPFCKVDLEDFVPLKGPPSNPQEYLQSVVHEARSIPDIVVAKIDPNKMKPKTGPARYVTSKYMTEQSRDTCTFAPSKNWQEKRLAQFAMAREEYIRHKAKLKSINRQTKKRPKLPIYPLPPHDDEDSWKFLCFGKSLKRHKKEMEEEGGPKESLSDNDDEALDNDEVLRDSLVAGGKTTVDIIADQSNNEDRTVDLSELEDGFPPMMRILLRMDAQQVEANLEYHTNWMNDDGFSHEQGRWIYALLSCLEKPLFPTVISVLRDLSRKCMDLRSKLNSRDDPLLNGLNLIICIVGRYYDQADLADPW